ncbi:MAG TPA: MoaD/ThiS family protein [Nocardioidaceae bacterium]
MKVSVTLKGRFAEEQAGYDGQLSLPEGARAADVAGAYGIDPRTCVVVVNGAAVPRSAKLTDGDRTQLYPAQAGG